MPESILDHDEIAVVWFGPPDGRSFESLKRSLKREGIVVVDHWAAPNNPLRYGKMLPRSAHAVLVHPSATSHEGYSTILAACSEVGKPLWVFDPSKSTEYARDFRSYYEGRGRVGQAAEHDDEEKTFLKALWVGGPENSKQFTRIKDTLRENGIEIKTVFGRFEQVPREMPVVDLVLLNVDLMGHAHYDKVKTMAVKNDVPCVIASLDTTKTLANLRERGMIKTPSMVEAEEDTQLSEVIPMATKKNKPTKHSSPLDVGDVTLLYRDDKVYAIAPQGSSGVRRRSRVILVDDLLFLNMKEASQFCGADKTAVSKAIAEGLDRLGDYSIREPTFDEACDLLLAGAVMRIDAQSTGETPAEGLDDDVYPEMPMEIVNRRRRENAQKAAHKSGSKVSVSLDKLKEVSKIAEASSFILDDDIVETVHASLDEHIRFFVSKEDLREFFTRRVQAKLGEFGIDLEI